jgi:hypothetical protein
MSAGSSAAVALEMLLRLTEPKGEIAHAVTEGAGNGGSLEIVFVESDGQGRPRGYQTIEAEAPPQITAADPPAQPLGGPSLQTKSLSDPNTGHQEDL